MTTTQQQHWQRELVVSDRDLGTPESVWLRSTELARCAELTPLLLPPLTPPQRILVIAPHPDDEVLAAGGLMRRLDHHQHHTIAIAAVTDGEASHPRSPTTSRAELAARRAEERVQALASLGLSTSRVKVTRLGYPDGGLRPFDVAALTHDLASHLVTRHFNYCLAPWERDGHPDHDAIGMAAKHACAIARIPLVQYLVWAWHWARPERADDIPWHRARRVTLSNDEALHKANAILAYQSQIAPLSPQSGDERVLPPAVVARFQRPFEVFLV